MQGLVDPASLEILISVESDRTATVSVRTSAKDSSSQTLRKALSSINQNSVHNILIGIAAGMKHLHDHALAHGKLNDSSVLINSDGTISITNEKGFVNFLKNTTKATESQQKSSSETREDIFSFGLLIDELFSKKPSNETSRRSTYASVPSYIPTSYQNLYKKCLSSNAASRPTFTQILDELQGMSTN